MAVSLDLSSSCIGEDIPGLFENRHLGLEPDRTRHTNRSPRYLFNGALVYGSGRRSYGWLNRNLPDYKLPLLDVSRREDPQYRLDRRRQLHRLRSRWTSDNDEGQDLARSDVPLPSDNFRRTPSLERQEAFRDEATAKRSFHRSLSTLSARSADESASVAELYRLGVLYDDEHVRGAGFDFKALLHDEPAYTLRPAKRARKLNNKSRGYEPEQLAYQDPELALDLDLSFAQLSRDDAVARFLISPPASETSDDDGHETRPRPVRWAVRVRYDAPPATPSLPTTTDSKDHDHVPDLVPDSTASDCNDDYDDNDYASDDDDQDWAVLSVDTTETETETDPDPDRAAASGAGAWVMLG